MKIDLYNQNAERIGTEDIPDKIFNLKINKDLLHQVVVSQQLNKKHATFHTKTRGEVRGGGRKPWRQKGTGRARHGSIRSPIWKGGGVVFGPTSKINFKTKINKKMKTKAMFVALSSKVKDDEFILLDDLKLDSLKTKKLVDILNKLISIKDKAFLNNKKKEKRPSVLIVIPEQNENLKRASSNIPNTNLLVAKDLNVLDILSNRYLFLLRDAIKQIEKVFVKK